MTTHEQPESTACEHGPHIYVVECVTRENCTPEGFIAHRERWNSSHGEVIEYCPVTELEELKEKLAVAVEALERVKAPLTDAEIDCVGDTSSEERFAMRNWTRKKIAREALEKIGELK